MDEHKAIVSQLNEATRVSSRIKNLRKAIVSDPESDPYDVIIMIGIIAGITYYIFTKDTWLLVTFIGLLTGGTIEKSRQSRKKP
jgi:hypothetical protein